MFIHYCWHSAKLRGTPCSRSIARCAYLCRRHDAQVSPCRLLTQLRPGRIASALMPCAASDPGFVCGTDPSAQRRETRWRPTAGKKPGATRDDAAGSSRRQVPLRPSQLGAPPSKAQGAGDQAGAGAATPQAETPSSHLGPSGLHFLPSRLSLHLHEAGKPGAQQRQPDPTRTPPSVTPEGTQKFGSWPPQRLLPARLGATTNRGAAAASAGQ